MPPFPANVYLMAFAAALSITALSVPLWRNWCLRRGHVDAPGHRKIHDHPVPLAGGLSLFTGLSVTLLGGIAVVFLAPLDEETRARLQYGLSARAFPLVAIWLGAAGMLLLGGLDDYRALPALPKFAGQLAIALLVATAGIRVTAFIPSTTASYLLTLLWILTVTNAFNFTDNMNGLCTGLGAIATACFGAIAARHGQYLVTLLAWSTTGALLAFLPFNFPRARSFLGDAGSHLVGYLLALLAILPEFYSPQHPGSRPAAILSPLLILAIPLLDLVQVTLVRTRNRRPFWLGDTNHLSHRLVRLGLSRTQAVLLLWALAAASGLLACLAL